MVMHGWMSCTGERCDDAVMERFFWSLKHAWAIETTYADRNAARFSVFQYIETFYNTEHLHQTLDDLSPDQDEGEHAPAHIAA